VTISNDKVKGINSYCFKDIKAIKLLLENEVHLARRGCSLLRALSQAPSMKQINEELRQFRF